MLSYPARRIMLSLPCGEKFSRFLQGQPPPEDEQKRTEEFVEALADERRRASSFYGMEAIELTRAAGLKRDFPALAGGSEIAGYCHMLMRDRRYRRGHHLPAVDDPLG